MMNHVITDYTSDSEEERKEVTQDDYTYDQMIEWAKQEHFEDEKTKEFHCHTEIWKNLRQTLLRSLQTELQAEVTLANKLSRELTSVAEQMRIREIHKAMLHAMPLTSLNSYGLHALLMTHESDIRIIHNLRTIRDELLRSIAEKQKFIDNYRAI
uniref:Bulb-type lectin domain-containing protein n=1 Tax=Tanacetum cinerariifolium TaxID=118510 RepID=A0A699IYX8_TANCI|nr:bulb-type lectin domain-containing protein [Tanacetum cinerariifolium]